MDKKTKKTAKKIAKRALSVKIQKVRTTINAAFSIIQLLMDKDFKWRLKLLIAEILPEIYYKYDIEILFNSEPYEERIDELEKELKDINKGQEVLFGEIKQEKISELKQRLETQKELLDEMTKKCIDIKLSASIETLKYGVGETTGVFLIPADIIGRINEQRFVIPEYKIKLIPRVDEDNK